MAPTILNTMKREWWNLAIIAVAFISIPLIWDFVPEQVPVHFNLQGEVDRYGSKATGLLTIPCVALLVYLIAIIAPLIDPKKRIEVDQKPMPAVRTIITFFLMAIQGMVLAAIFGDPSFTEDYLYLVMLALFMVMGNFMGTIKPNYFIGVRTPWTLEDPDIWKKTHRATGKVWMGLAAIMIVVYFLAGTEILRMAFGPAVAVFALFPFGFSYYLYQTRTVEAG